MKKIKSKVLLSVCSVCAASLLSATSLAGCTGASAADYSQEKEYIGEKLSTFLSGINFATYDVSVFAFGMADSAARFYKEGMDEEDLHKIVSDLYLESLTVTDSKGKIIAAYPTGEEGKDIRDTENKAEFYKVNKGVCDKLMADPVYQDDLDTYLVHAGVKRLDDSGSVIISYLDPDYGDATGTNLVRKCSVDTIALKNNTVIGSTLHGVDTNDTLESMGIAEQDLEKDSFTMQIDSRKYTAFAVTKGEYTIITAFPS